MSSISSFPSTSTNIQLRYGYLLCCKNGTILPLVATDHLPSTITVLPSLETGITLLQEIPLLPSSPCLGVPEAALVPAPVKKTKDEAVSKEITSDISGSVIQDQAFSTDPPPSSSSSTPSGAGLIHDAVQTRTLFPSVFSPPKKESTSSTSSSSSAGSGPPYVHPHSREPSPPNTQAQIPSCSLLTRRSLYSNSFKQCPTYLSSSACLLGSMCTFRHDMDPVKSGRHFTRRADDDASAGSGANSEDETSNMSIGNHGEETDTTSERDAVATCASPTGDESIANVRGKKFKSKTEVCAYFHRRDGCKRGKDCFYIHESKDGSTSLPGPSGGGYSPVSSKKALTANSSINKKLEGKWRRVEPFSTAPTTISEKGLDEEVVAEDVAVHQKTATITCPTPGRTISTTDPAKHIKTHCTFFLRFGECDYWPACKFSHERPEGSVRWCGSRLPSSPKKIASSICGSEEGEKEEADAGDGGVTVLAREMLDSLETASIGGLGDMDIDMTFVEGISGIAKVAEGQLISLVD